MSKDGMFAIAQGMGRTAILSRDRILSRLSTSMLLLVRPTIDSYKISLQRYANIPLQNLVCRETRLDLHIVFAAFSAAEERKIPANFRIADYDNRCP